MTMRDSHRPRLPLLFLGLALYSNQSEVAHASSFSTHRHASFIVSSSSPSTSAAACKRRPFRRPSSCRHPVNRTVCNADRLLCRLSSREEDDFKPPNADGTNERKSSFVEYGRPSDIDSSSFGPLLPIAEAVDSATGGWGLSYADLHPATPRTTAGQVFLATNFFYAAAGLRLGIEGDWFYGGLTELAGVVSFIYHYAQLDFGKERSEVRLVLLIDYFTAGSALLVGGVYMVQAGIGSVPIDALVSAAVAVLTLSLSWVWEFGYPYIFWHSLWHISSAYTGYLVGQDHLSRIAG